MSHEMSFSWRSRSRIGVAILVTFGFGIIAATAGVPWSVRILAAVVFFVGTAVILDAVIFTSSWRMTASALRVPTLLSRKREITGRDDIAVELREGRWSRLAVTGPRGVRLERINPLIGGSDLRRWWDSLPEQ